MSGCRFRRPGQLSLWERDVMHQARAAAVNGRKVMADGKWLTVIGNISVAAGDLIWTDGRCVYGHHSMSGGSAVITAAMEPEKMPGIPVLLGQQYLYTYKEGLEQVETVWWPGYRLIWNNGQEIYAWKYRYDLARMSARLSALIFLPIPERTKLSFSL